MGLCMNLNLVQNSYTFNYMFVVFIVNVLRFTFTFSSKSCKFGFKYFNCISWMFYKVSFFHDNIYHLHLTLKMYERSQLCLFGFVTTWLGIVTNSDLFAHSNHMFMFCIHAQKWSLDSSCCPFDFVTNVWTLQSMFLHHLLIIDSYF